MHPRRLDNHDLMPYNRETTVANTALKYTSTALGSALLFAWIGWPMLFALVFVGGLIYLYKRGTR